MDIEDIKQALEFPSKTFPKEAVQAAIEQPEAITPLLLKTLQDTLDDPQAVCDKPNYWLHIFALFLLAQFREPRAYPLMLQLFSLPKDVLRDLLGDVVTGSGPGLLASVWDGDLEPLQRMIENPAVYEYSRSSGLEAMLTLVKCGRLDQAIFSEYLRDLFNGQLEREPCFVWDTSVLMAELLYLPELLPQIRQAFADGLCDPFFNRLEDVEKTLQSQDKSLEALARERSNLIDDTVAELQQWVYFQPESKTSPQPSKLPMTAGLPVVKGPKVGRNDPCPCGSGKKYKKCCLNKTA